jgi:YegS/Rv2252/BmrU family lipid kinase
MLTIVANPRSGKGRGREYLEKTEARLRALGREFESKPTSGPGDARRFARAAAEAGREAVVVIGGDGTFFEAVNGVFDAGRPLPLAQLPVGTGNSFIKDLGIDSFEDGLAALEAGKTRRVDVGRATAGDAEFRFVNLLGAGFVARAARRAQAFKIFGDFAYVIAVLLGLPGLRARPLSIVADGATTVREALFVEICNSRKTGGDMLMAPDARLDDGLFDVVVAKAMTRRQLLALFPQIFTGKHVESQLVEVIRCARVEAAFDAPEPATPDGELIGSTPIVATVEPAALEVFAL